MGIIKSMNYNFIYGSTQLIQRILRMVIHDEKETAHSNFIPVNGSHHYIISSEHGRNLYSLVSRFVH